MRVLVRRGRVIGDFEILYDVIIVRRKWSVFLALFLL